ncbi:MAG: DUF2334 domain-containing protein [Deltaproteobacteria bacterium]|nr:DUF2334 domain-containing protein [Deltaproteobacteria bacterium]
MMQEIIFNLNLDDFHPQTDEDGDFGGDLKNGNFGYLANLWNEFPQLKITLFTTPNWIDSPFTRSPIHYVVRRWLGRRPVVSPRTGEPFRLDKHSEWCAKVRGLVEAGRLEIAVHGYNHYNPNLSVHGQEFVGLDYEESKKRVLAAEEVFRAAGLPFVRIFRPPGWGVSKGMLLALKDFGYRVAFSPSHERKAPSNYSIKEPPELALVQAERSGAVFAKAHMCCRYGRETIENGLNETHYQNIAGALRLLHSRFRVQYTFLEQIL